MTKCTQKSIKIAFAMVAGAKYYKVVSCKNSTQFLPGLELREDDVQYLCTNPNWDATIVPLNTEQGAA